MPERPEIAIMSYNLCNLFKNKICKYVVIMEKYKDGYKNGLYSSSQLNYQLGNDQLGNWFKYIIINRKLTNITSRGKKIIFEFIDNDTDQYRFVSGCGLDGRWSLTESEYTCIKVIFDDLSVAYYEEKYIGGNFSICKYPSNEYNHIFSDVGPDWMTDETSWEVFYNMMRNPKTLNWMICDYMLEQKFMSGIGNWIRAEVLLKCGIYPYRKLEFLSDTDLYNIWYHTKDTIFQAYNLGGLTIKDYTDPFGNKGLYKQICYGRKMDDFGNLIVTKLDKKKRKIYYCPSRQF